jgi:hypothetical protein
MSGATVKRPAADFGVLHWTAAGALFELRSPDPAVLDRARIIFGPWLNGASTRHPPKARFFVEAVRRDGRGRWRVVRDGSEMKVVKSRDLALTAVEYGSIVELLKPESGVVAIHAALLSMGGRGALLVGPKEAGKSTLACALWRAGWALHSDDSAILEDGHRARGVPRRISLRSSSRALLGPELWERIASLPATTRSAAGGLRFHPSEAFPGVAPVSVGVAAVIFLGRGGFTAQPGKLQRLDAGRALLALAPYCHRREPGIGRAIQVLQPLADRVPMFDLGRSELATMCRNVEEAIAT